MSESNHPIVTLLTDFGTVDPYVAAMKGVILGRCPSAQIVDITHDIPPQDVAAASFVLAHLAGYFPPGSLHVVVVDPGVGTRRRILAGRFGGQRFLIPDNGVITMVAQSMPQEALVAVENPHYLPSRASTTFHGRDVFAPLAGEVLNGLDICGLGPPCETYQTLDLPAPHVDGQVVNGCIVHIDRFGNLISNIPQDLLERTCGRLDRLRVFLGGREVGALRLTYAVAAAGQPLALINSMGLVEVAVNQGSAARVLGRGLGAEVHVSE